MNIVGERISENNSKSVIQKAYSIQHPIKVPYYRYYAIVSFPAMLPLSDIYKVMNCLLPIFAIITMFRSYFLSQRASLLSAISVFIVALLIKKKSLPISWNDLMQSGHIHKKTLVSMDGNNLTIFTQVKSLVSTSFPLLTKE